MTTSRKLLEGYKLIDLICINVDVNGEMTQTLTI